MIAIENLRCKLLHIGDATRGNLSKSKDIKLVWISESINVFVIMLSAVIPTCNIKYLIINIMEKYWTFQ